MKVQKHSLNLTKKPSSFAKLSTFVLVQSIGTLFAEMKKITQSYQTKKNLPYNHEQQNLPVYDIIHENFEQNTFM